MVTGLFFTRTNFWSTMEKSTLILAMQYAYTHFLQNGEAAGFIWHDELCNVDGTDVAVTLTDHVGSVAVTADK